MKKIVIFGNSGSGKSSLAKKLHFEQGLTHLDLDTLAWNETKPPTRKELTESKHLIKAFIKQHKSWVIEGCYSDLLSLVLPYVNEVIFMNLSVSLCQENARNRPWEPHKYVSKAEQDANLPMLLEWIAAYVNRSDEFSYQAHTSLYNLFQGTKQIITENQTTGRKKTI